MGGRKRKGTEDEPSERILVPHTLPDVKMTLKGPQDVMSRVYSCYIDEMRAWTSGGSSKRGKGASTAAPPPPKRSRRDVDAISLSGSEDEDNTLPVHKTIYEKVREDVNLHAKALWNVIGCFYFWGATISSPQARLESALLKTAVDACVKRASFYEGFEKAQIATPSSFLSPK